MRIALIADIHGNLVALETVLTELAREPIDQLICLGDVAALGPQPGEVIARLRKLRCPVIMGNTDAWMVSPERHGSDTEVLREITAWGIQRLATDDLEYIRAFSPLLEFPLDEGRGLLVYHGSPRSFDDVISAVTPGEQVARMLMGQRATVMAGGHTHIQMVRRYEDSYLINVGSVGLAGVNAGSPELPNNQHVRWAEYGILQVESGRLSIDLRRVPLDMSSVLAAGERSQMPNLDWWLSKWE